MSRTPNANTDITHQMHGVSIDSVNKHVQIVNSWESAILKARRKIARLKADIVIFQEMKDSGEPWPTQSANQSQEQQHSV